MAEAVLARKGRDRFTVASAGSQAAEHMHPLTLEALGEHGIDWTGHSPKNIAAVMSEPWDLIITVCDRAREACPTFPGEPVFAHWSIEDPSKIQGGLEVKRRAFRDALAYLSRRIDLLMALPFESLERGALELRLGQLDRSSPE